jgi:hypothetical protein
VLAELQVLEAVALALFTEWLWLVVVQAAELAVSEQVRLGQQHCRLVLLFLLHHTQERHSLLRVALLMHHRERLTEQ